MSQKIYELKMCVLTGVFVFLCCCSGFAQVENGAPRAVVTEEQKMEAKATALLARGVEFIAQKQEDRGLKVVESVTTDFPRTQAAFKAFVELGKYFTSKRDTQNAMLNLQKAIKSSDRDVQAEAYYRMGICYYEMNNMDKAFFALRKVTSDYPWSEFASESYYYIGLCHFKQHHWFKAVEALENVGVNVESTDEAEVLGEAGQRLFVKVDDGDLIVLSELGKGLTVEVYATSGDKEKLQLQVFGKDGTSFMGSIQTVLGSPVPGDGVLQVMGGEVVSVVYVDQNNEDGRRDIKLLSKVRMVSTASIGFTDGAYREYSQAILDGQPAFIRVKDFDMDVSPNPDTVHITLLTEYRAKKRVDYDDAGVDLEPVEEAKKRAEIGVTLTETEAHSGIFVAEVPVRLVDSESTIQSDGQTAWAMPDDELRVVYQDSENLQKDPERTISYKARILVGDIQDVKIEHRRVDQPLLKARKNLIEAKIFAKLGQIFKDVGLQTQASSKAEEGLERVEFVIKAGLRNGFGREMVEDAFSVKWDLLLLQGRMTEAMNCCDTLIKMYPDSPMVDKALMKMAVAKIESEDPEQIKEARGILMGILGLARSDIKAEAQFMIAELVENELEAASDKNAKEPAGSRARGVKIDFSKAMLEYKKVADQWPDSAFAGRALGKMVNYYTKERDYSRAVLLLEQVFADYPDAAFLDEMLLRWAVVAYRLGDMATSKQKVDQLMSEYPNSPAAKQAVKLAKALDSSGG